MKQSCLALILGLLITQFSFAQNRMVLFPEKSKDTISIDLFGLRLKTVIEK